MENEQKTCFGSVQETDEWKGGGGPVLFGDWLEFSFRGPIWAGSPTPYYRP